MSVRLTLGCRATTKTHHVVKVKVGSRRKQADRRMHSEQTKKTLKNERWQRRATLTAQIRCGRTCLAGASVR